MSPWNWIVTLSCVKVAVQPASQNWPIETRAVGSSLKRCAMVADWGRPLIRMRPSCVEWIMCASGSETWMGFVVGMISTTSFVEMGKKCPVVPVSAIVLWILGVVVVVVGGSTGGVAFTC